MEKKDFHYPKNLFPLVRIKGLFQKYICREPALVNQTVGLVYKYVSITQKNKAISGRSV